MRILSYTVPADWDGSTIKGFARGRLGFSAGALAQQKFEGGILLNGSPCHVNAFLRTGDRLEFPLKEEETDYPGVELPLSILYEDEDFILIDKPPYMPVHPSPGHDADSLLNALAWHYHSTGQRCRIRPLYRLDKDTSGGILFAKHRVAAGAQLEKTYCAVCQGRLEGSGFINLPIGLEEGSKIRRECGHGQSALTHWEALASDGSHTLLAIRLETGRTHQIRVHMAHLGYPLAGDDLYGGSLDRISRQALHCGLLRVECRALKISQIFMPPLSQDLLRAFPWILEPWRNRKEAFYGKP